jgi:uncharacterized membrane protein
MAFCAKCGNQMGDGVKFCPSCGASVAGKSAKPVKAETQTEELQADPNDAEQNKGMAVLAYLLFFIPLLTGDYKKSPFVKYHTNQGLLLFIFSMGGSIISSILMVVLIGFVLIFLVGIASLIFFVLGLMNVLNGRMKPLPLIGRFTIIS